MGAYAYSLPPPFGFPVERKYFQKNSGEWSPDPTMPITIAIFQTSEIGMRLDKLGKLRLGDLGQRLSRAKPLETFDYYDRPLIYSALCAEQLWLAYMADEDSDQGAVYLYFLSGNDQIAAFGRGDVSIREFFLDHAPAISVRTRPDGTVAEVRKMTFDEMVGFGCVPDDGVKLGG